MRRYKYSARVEMDPAGASCVPQRGVTCRVTVRARHHQTHSSKFFSALATAPAPGLSWPGDHRDHSTELTLSVLGDDVPDYLDAGDELALWRGHEIGHGIITRRLFLWAETP